MLERKHGCTLAQGLKRNRRPLVRLQFAQLAQRYLRLAGHLDGAYVSGSPSTFIEEITVKHALLWIDKKDARIFEVDSDKVDESIVHSPGPHIHRHANEEDLRVRNHPDDEPRYFAEVTQALKGHGQVLVVGPSMTKLHFLRYVQGHDHVLEARIVGIESADHPTDPQLVAHLRHYFHEAPPRRDP